MCVFLTYVYIYVTCPLLLTYYIIYLRTQIHVFHWIPTMSSSLLDFLCHYHCHGLFVTGFLGNHSSSPWFHGNHTADTEKRNNICQELTLCWVPRPQTSMYSPYRELHSELNGWPGVTEPPAESGLRMSLSEPRGAESLTPCAAHHGTEPSLAAFCTHHTICTTPLEGLTGHSKASWFFKNWLLKAGVRRLFFVHRICQN